MYIDELKHTINKSWAVVEDKFEIARNRHYESVFTLGTGYVSTRGTIEEGFEDDNQALEYTRLPVVVTLEKIPSAKSRWGTFMPVVQAEHPFLRIGIVNLPYYLGLRVSADGEDLNLEESRISGYCRWLDLRTATLYRTFVWETKSGKRINLLFKRFMDPGQRFVCVQQCRITMLSGSANITVAGFIDNDVRTNGFDKYISRSVDSTDRQIIYSDITTNLNSRVITASRMVVDKTEDFDVIKQERRITSIASFTLNEGEEATVQKVSAVIADAYYPKDELIDTAVRMINENIATDAEQLHQKHVDIWSKRWEVSDIQIDANDHKGYNSQLAIRTAIYHLLRSRAEDDDRAQAGPKCTTTEVYFGGCFWDMEIFILPFYLYTNPRAARTTAMFRYLNLPAARKIAKEYGYIGAKYPWTSAFNGTETCPAWEYAETQVHIVADVALGIWHYYLTSGDSELLYNYGAEVIIETARYWTQRVDKVPGKAGYQIYGVMGPDEYKMCTNNNAYTNHLAKFNLNIAAKTIEILQKQAPEKFKQLRDKIALDEKEKELFREIADGIPIGIDKEKQIVWECDNYDSIFAPIDIEALWTDRDRYFGVLVSQEKRFRSKCLKQSDVVVLLAVFPESYTQQQKVASFDYYGPITTHDSSSSMCSHMVVAANIGRADTAYEYWKKSIDIDFGRLPRSSEGLHAVNVGGMWQEVVFGFAGLVNALNTDVLTFNPCMPKEFNSLGFRILWKQNPVKVTITDKKLEVENYSNSDVPFRVKGNRHVAKANDKIQVTYKK